MKFYFAILIGMLLTGSACKKEVNGTTGQPSLIFGMYYGYCAGETCVEIFQLDEQNLREDILDHYPNSQDGSITNFSTLMSAAQRTECASLLSSIPDTLFQIEQTIIGQPDAGDWGGFYIECQHENRRRFWLIDTQLQSVPSSLHAFLQEVKAKVILLRS